MDIRINKKWDFWYHTAVMCHTQPIQVLKHMTDFNKNFLQTLTQEGVTSPSRSAYQSSVRVSPTTFPNTEHVTKQATAVLTVVGVQATTERQILSR